MSYLCLCPAVQLVMLMWLSGNENKALLEVLEVAWVIGYFAFIAFLAHACLVRLFPHTSRPCSVVFRAYKHQNSPTHTGSYASLNECPCSLCARSYALGLSLTYPVYAQTHLERENRAPDTNAQVTFRETLKTPVAVREFTTKSKIKVATSKLLYV